VTAAAPRLQPSCSARDARAPVCTSRAPATVVVADFAARARYSPYSVIWVSAAVPEDRRRQRWRRGQRARKPFRDAALLAGAQRQVGKQRLHGGPALGEGFDAVAGGDVAVARRERAGLALPDGLQRERVGVPDAREGADDEHIGAERVGDLGPRRHGA